MNHSRAALLILTILFSPSLANAGEKNRPNIVVFLSDDHGYLDSTVYGATDVRTPNMAKLAKRGMTFTHAFVASPSCAPSRAALFTGLMPARNGAEANHTQPRKGIPILTQILKQLGYDVAAFGKVAHGWHPIRYGFDHASKQLNVKQLARYLKTRNAKKPICLFVGTRRPHVPWPMKKDYDPKKLNLPPTFVDTPAAREFRARYYTDITEADRQLGQVYVFVQRKLGPNVLVIYTSDHGAQWPFGKWNLYDAGVRTPFIAAWPGKIPANTKTDAMISWVDIIPTLIEVAGGAPPKKIDGRSFKSVLLGNAKTHRKEIYATHSGDGKWNVYPIRCVRTPQFHYILNLYPKYQHTTHIDKAQGKGGLIVWQSWLLEAKKDKQAARVVQRYYQRPKEELYDVKADPHERKNLAALPKYQAALKALRAKVQKWMREQGDKKTVFQKPHIIGPDGPKPIKPVTPGIPKKRKKNKNVQTSFLPGPADRFLGFGRSLVVQEYRDPGAREHLFGDRTEEKL